MTNYTNGDKIKVIRPRYGFEPYQAGDIFTVLSVEEDELDENYDVIRTREYDGDDNYLLFALEVEHYAEPPKDYDEDAEYAAKDADVSTWVKEEEIDEYNEIVIGLSQAIAMKAEQMRGEHDVMPEMDNHWINEVNLNEEDSEWEAAEPVGKEIIYDDYNPDSVEHPSHYTQGAVEVIDIIAQTVSGYDDGFTAHCVGTATKYLNRAPHKHATPLEDLRKAAKYLEFAINHEEKKQN